MKISIYPKSKDEIKVVPLLFSVTGLTGSNIILSTFESLTLKEWEKVKNNKNHALNKRLDIKAKAIEKVVDDLLANNTFSPTLLKERYNQKHKPQKSLLEAPEAPLIKNNITIKEVCEMLVKAYGKTKSWGHLRKVNYFVSDLEFFKPSATFQDLTPLFWEQFYNFLVTKKAKNDKIGLSNNTIATVHLKMLRMACSYAIKQEIKVPTCYLDYSIKKVPSTKIVLNWQEVEKIAKVKLYLDIHIKIRDLYIFSCYTGLRHQDLNLNKSNFLFEDHKVFLNIITKKAKKPLRILLNSQALAIAKKYDYQLPVVSNQKCNLHLKYIGRHAKLERMVEHISFVGNERKVEVKEVYNFISMHQARHNFSIQFLKLNSKQHGLKAMMSLQKILTHSSLKTTEIYGRMIENDEDLLISAFDN